MNDEFEFQLAERIYAELERHHSQTVAELVASLDASPEHVTHCLTQTLVRRVYRDSTFRWQRMKTDRPTPVETDADPEPAAQAAPAPTRVEQDAPSPSSLDNGEPDAQLLQLSHYFLECIGFDIDTGASAFAQSKNGRNDYAELPALPLVLDGHLWHEEEGVEDILDHVQSASNKLAWIGYPVSVRRHETPGWKGYFVEPVLLWPIQFPKDRQGPPEIVDESPIVNARFLKGLAMGDSMSLAAEAAQLAEDIGLNVPHTKTPSADELIDSLLMARPEWNWKERILPANCSGGDPLSVIREEGIYNRCIVIPGEKSPFTQGLESELAALSVLPASSLAGTALQAWMRGHPGAQQGATEDSQPVLEVVPMNSEQRAAVRAAMTEPLTVVTGPPGTGKSQVVTNILVNAAWRNMRVLFASKNNKAVDVVTARVNNLGTRPVLLRLGANDSQARLADYLTQALATSANVEDQLSFEAAQARYLDLSLRLGNLDTVQQETLSARNAVDRLDAAAASGRAFFGADSSQLDLETAQGIEQGVQELGMAFSRLKPAAWYEWLIWRWLSAHRQGNLEEAWNSVLPLVQWLGLGTALPTQDTQQATALSKLGKLSEEALKVGQYMDALAALNASASFEDIARQRLLLTEQLGQQSAKLWRDWVKLAPSRLTAAQRKDVADYLAVHQATSGPESAPLHNGLKQKQRALQTAISAIFTCWAVTSLSARGRIPLEPGYFDLVVIDEASQCDIASVLPLLYRAKRAVIIGDPMQLRHISSLTRAHDSALQHKYALTEGHIGWMYSVSSLYDLAAGLARREDMHSLRDHHRSHADIITFSNRFFYENRLRVATREGALKTVEGRKPGVVWQHVTGQVVKSSRAGASNLPEAQAVVAALEQLLVDEGYSGTVGVVTPFRAQAQLLQELVAANPKLAPCRARNDLMVETVHRFQGDERDVMFFSPVVAKGITEGAKSFLRYNGNLFNVAITRARSLLHVVGDQSVAQECDVTYLSEFAAYCARLQGRSEEPEVYALDDTDEPGAYPDVPRAELVSDWERQFYALLHARGIRPLPQFSVEHYELNFALIVGKHRLNLEVDGRQFHQGWTGELCQRTQLRNQRLLELGWEIKRFWTWELRDNPQACVDWVVDWVRRHGGPAA